MADFETLNLTITADTAKASSGLDSLTKSLSTFQTMLNSIDGTNAFNSMNNLTSGIQALVSGLSGLGNSMAMLQGVTDVMRTTATAISTISSATQGLDGGNLSSLAAGISDLSTSLSEASSLIGFARFDSAATNLEAFTSAITVLQGALSTFSQSVDSSSMNSLANLTQGIAQMGSSMGSINADAFTTLAAGINHVVNAVSSIDEATIDRVSRLATALNQLAASGAGMENFQMPNLGSSGGGGGNSASQNVQRFLGNFASEYASGLKKVGSLLGSSLKAGGKVASAALQGVGSAAKFMYEKFSLSTLMGNNLFGSLMRMARMRILRSIIRGVANAFKEGMQNIAHYSAEANAVLSQFSTGAQYAKNSLAASLYPAIASLVGIFTALINVAVRAFNVVNMLFSMLGGKTTYIRATKQTKDFTSATSGAAGAASALKQELMGFDEINALSPSGGGGGGGGGGGLADYASMFEEVPVEQWVQDAIDSGDFTIFGTKLAQKLNKAMASIPWTKLKSGAKELAENITEAINGFIAEISPTLVAQTISEAINTAATFVSTFWNNTNWFELGYKIGESLVTALRNIDVPTLASAITGKLRAMITLVKGWLSGSGKNFLGELGTKIGELFNEMLGTISASDLAGVFVGVLQDAANGAVNLVNTIDWDALMTQMNKFLSDAISGMPWGQVSTAITTLLRKAIKFFTLPSTQTNITNLTEKVTTFVVNAINSIEWDKVGIALAGIANAIVTGLNNALSGEEGSKAKTDLFDGIKSFFANIDFEALINIASIALDSSLGKILTLGAVGKALLPLIPTATKYTALGTLAFSLPGAFDIVASIGKLTKSSTSSDLTESIASLVGKALFGAAGAYVGIVAGAKGAALGFSVGVSLYTTVESIGNSLGVNKYSGTINSTSKNKETAQSIKDIANATSDYKTASERVGFLKQALSDLWGIDVSDEAFTSLKGLADIDYSATTLDVDSLADGITYLNDNLAGLSTEGKLNSYIESGVLPGLSTKAEEASEAVTELSDSVTDMTDASTTGLETMQESVDGISDSVSTLTEVTTEMPETIMIDSNSLDGVAESAATAATNVTELYLGLNRIKLGLSKFAGSFDSLTDSADEATTEVTGLKDAITSLPDSKTVSVYAKNVTNVQRGIKNIKNALDGLKSVTISIKVKAGLTSGAKSFLTQLKSAADTTTQTSIANLLKFSQFARGGFPSSGDIFMANENGRQELVGRIGNQPAVANQDQIGDAIFKYMDQYNQGSGYDTDALASAIVRGIKAAGLGATYLDGKQLATSINKETQRSGKPAIQF